MALKLPRSAWFRCLFLLDSIVVSNKNDEAIKITFVICRIELWLGQILLFFKFNWYQYFLSNRNIPSRPRYPFRTISYYSNSL